MSFDCCIDKAVLDYLQEITTPEPPLQAHIRQNSGNTPDTPSSRIIGPVEGQLLHFLVALSQTKRCLEIGTFLGYSALYIASALPKDGQLFTCEINPENAQKAQQHFDQSPDGSKITLVLGDALQTVPTLPGPFDSIFLDAHQAQYPQYHELCVAQLRQGGWMAVDNALWRGEVVRPEASKYATAIDAFNRRAKADPRLETVLLPLRDGLLLARKR